MYARHVELAARQARPLVAMQVVPPPPSPPLTAQVAAHLFKCVFAGRKCTPNACQQFLPFHVLQVEQQLVVCGRRRPPGSSRSRSACRCAGCCACWRRDCPAPGGHRHHRGGWCSGAVAVQRQDSHPHRNLRPSEQRRQGSSGSPSTSSHSSSWRAAGATPCQGAQQHPGPAGGSSAACLNTPRCLGRPASRAHRRWQRARPQRQRLRRARQPLGV